MMGPRGAAARGPRRERAGGAGARSSRAERAAARLGRDGGAAAPLPKRSPAKKQRAEPVAADDPFGLRTKFVTPQRRLFAKALAEIQEGHKKSHWSWYCFPNAPYIVDGKEAGSAKAKRFALRDAPKSHCGDEAARAFLKLPTVEDVQHKGPKTITVKVNLRENLLRMYEAIATQLEKPGVTLVGLVGFLDDPKLRSSLRLFERISRGGFDDEINAVCRRAMAAMKEEPDGLAAPADAAGAPARKAAPAGTPAPAAAPAPAPSPAPAPAPAPAAAPAPTRAAAHSGTSTRVGRNEEGGGG